MDLKYLRQDFEIDYKRKLHPFYKLYFTHTSHLNNIKNNILCYFTLYILPEQKKESLTELILSECTRFIKYLLPDDILTFIEDLQLLTQDYICILEQEEYYEACANLKYLNDLLLELVNIKII